MASYEKRGTTWSVRFRFQDENKRLSGFKTKRQAEEAYIDFMNKARAGGITFGLSLTFSDLTDEYLDYQRGRVKPSTLYDIENKIDKNIRPFFHKLVINITPYDVLQWQQSLQHFSHAYQMHLRTLLGAIFNYGEKYHNLPNVVRKVDAPRNLEAHKEMSFWTKEQVQKFLSVIEDERFKLFFHFLYISGCRKGEALALSWADFDFAANTVNINKNITRKSADSTWAITTPKNKSSVRKIDLPPSFMNALESYRESQETLSQFVFGTDKPIPERTLDRKFKEYAEAAELPAIRIHDLRHSCASVLISNGVSVTAVAKRLGHANITQTLNTYSHLMPSDTERIISILG